MGWRILGINIDKLKRRIRRLRKKKRLTDYKLVYAFMDNKGYFYYRHEDQTLLSIERLAQLKQYTTWILRGMTNEVLHQLIDEADKAWVHFVKTGEDMAKVTAIHTEMRLRCTKISEIDLYYNLLAVQYIREDEHPTQFNNSIHLEKVEAFKEAAKDLDSFFFALPEYRELCKLLNITEEEWPQFVALSKQVESRNQSVISMFQSNMKSSSNGTT